MQFDEKEVATSVITTFVEDSLKFAWNKVSKFFKDLDAKDAIKYGEAYEEYLRNTKNRYSKIKTLIYRHTPKELYSFYECIGVRYNGKIIDTADIGNLLNESSRVVVTGTGGCGKSILIKHLFLNTIEKTSFIPVLIELRSFNIFEEKNISLKDAVYNALAQNGFKLESEYFEYSLEEGGYVILLDGFDEVNRDKMIKVSSEIRNLCSTYQENRYIISSRPSDEFIGWNDFTEMSVMSLTKQQALSLVKKIEFDQRIKEVFYKELNDSLYDRYKSFASNPLLLNIMLLTFNNHASIPDRLNDFYEQAFSTLFNMHDASKDAYVRDIRSGLGCEDFKLVFAYICFKSYFRDEYEFMEARLRDYIQKSKEKFEQLHFTVDDFQEDLTMSVCMLVKEGLNYRFSHRSFQEYFAAWYTCKLTDDVQYKLLTNWLKESNTAVNDSYFTMLYNMQGDKVNKVVLTPGIREMKQMYKENGYNFDMYECLFSGIVIREILDKDRKKTKTYRLGLIIKNQYYCSILMLVCRLNNYPYPDINLKEQEEVAKELNSLKIKDKENELITFSRAIEAIGEERLDKAFAWIKSQLEFAFSVMENCDNISVGRKKKVLSILDEI